MRYRQPHLIPIQCWRSRLQRVALKVHRLEIFLVPEFAFHFIEARQLVVGRPQLLQILQMRQMFQLGHLVVGKVEHAQRSILLETAEVGDRIMRHVEFLQVLQIREPTDIRETVRLDGENAQVGEAIEILYHQPGQSANAYRT